MSNHSEEKDFELPIPVSINGEPRTIPRGLTVAGMLRHIGVEGTRVAVELNRQIVRRADWDATPVPEQAQVEVVEFVGGG